MTRQKIHLEDLSVEDHAIIFKETGFCIPLSLWGVFSYFSSSLPMQAMLHGGNDVYLLTPDTWDPHSDAYALNEESMTDW